MSTIGKHYDLDTDVTLANNSDNTIASQKATKAYIDNNYIPASAMEEAATVAKTGDYNDLLNKPTIPTVGNAEIEIQKNSTTVDSFTLNQSTDKTINITVPTKTSDITNDSGFLTSHQSIKTLNTNNTTAQTASSSETIAGSGTINLHKVSKTGSYNDLLNKPTIPTVNNATLTIQKNGTTVNTFTANASTNVTANITVPTKTSDITNDSGYITSEDIPTKLSDFTDDLGSSPVHTHSQYLTSHQTIKTLKTDNTTGQTASSGEALTGSGTINLHKVSKTGSYSDLLDKPTIPTTTDSVTSGSTAALTSGGAYTNLVRRKSTTTATGGANQGVYVDANGQVQACNATTSTYSSTGTTAVNGTAVASALGSYIPRNFGGSVPSSQPQQAVASESYGTAAIPKGYFKNVNLLHTVKNYFYRANKNLYNSGTVTVTCNYEDKVSNLGIAMLDGSYSGYYTQINPSTMFSEKPFVWQILSSQSFEASDVVSLFIVGHRFGGMSATKFKIEVTSAYNSGNPTWYTLINYSGSAVGICQKHFRVYSSEISTSPAYHNVCGIRLTISESTSTVFNMSEIMLLGSRGTENVSDGVHALDVGKGGKIVADLTIPTEYGSFIGNLTGTADKATKDADGNTISTTYATKSELPTVNNASLVIQKNSSNVATFTANASANVTCNITVPTKVSDLNNDSGFITGITANNVTTALGYTPYNSTNPNGYTSNTGTVRSVQVQAGTGLASSTSTAQNTTLSTTISVASGYKLPTTTEWSGKQDALPTQSGQSGKFLTTNGSTLSWATVSTGTSDYSSLTNKPSINSVTLSGNKTSSDLGLQPALATQTVYSAKGSATKVPQITTNNLGQVTSITEVTISQPTVNNATLSLQKNGTTVATFRANSASNVTCNITVPTKTSELTNNSGFITGITANNVTTALGYTPYNSSNPSGYTTNTGTVTSVRVQAGTGLSSSTSTAQNTTLNTTISIASGYKLPTTTEWSNKQDKLTAQTAYTSKGTATKVPQITTNTLGQVTGITEVDITHPTELPSQTGQSGKFLTTNGSTVSWAATSTNIDNSTITKNGSNQIQTVGYKDVRTSNTLKTWTGTRAQYDAIVTKDANTLYNITDDTDTTAAMLELLYPVGAVYIGTMDVCPLATLGIGSWETQISRFLVEQKTPTKEDRSWYNLYSDGWCEQGGTIQTSAVSGGVSSAVVTFSKPFIDQHYDFNADVVVKSDNTSLYLSGLTSRSATSVTMSSKYLNGGFGAAGTVTYRWTCSYYTSITSNLKMWRRIS